MGQTQVDVRQRPGYKASVLQIASGPALQPDSAACPRAGILYIPEIYLVYTWYIPCQACSLQAKPSTHHWDPVELSQASAHAAHPQFRRS